MNPVDASALPELTASDRLTLLRAARQALEAHLAGDLCPGPETAGDLLETPCATFVTLRTRRTGELRGCRGETQAQQALLDSVQAMAVASAVGDPRFEPLRLTDLDEIRIEISVLSPMWPIRPEDVEVGRHGLMILHRQRAGLLLPSVPTSCGWDRERFLVGLCLKAGLPADSWRDADVELMAFETLSWGEEEAA